MNPHDLAVLVVDRPWSVALRRLRGSGIGARLARGTLWLMLTAALVRGLGLLAAMLAAQLMGVEAFGQIGVVQQVVLTLGTLVGLGVGTVASRFIAASRHDPAQAGRYLTAVAMWSWVAALTGAALLAGGAPWLARGPLAAPALVPALQAAAPLLMLSLVAQAQSGALMGFEAFRASAMSNLVGGLFGLPLQLLGAWQWGVPGFIAGLAAAELLRWWLGRAALAQAMRAAGVVWCRPQRRELADLLWFGLPSTAASLLVGPVLLLGFAIVGRQGGGYAEIGLFQATQQYRNLLLFVAVQSAGAIVPVLAATHAAGDLAGLARGLRRTFVWASGSSVLLSLLLAALAPLAMGGFGRAFAEHPVLLWWMAGLAPVQALTAVGSAALSAINKPWAMLGATAVYALGALLVVLQWPSAWGLVLSQGVGSMLPVLLMAWALRRAWRGA